MWNVDKLVWVNLTARVKYCTLSPLFEVLRPVINALSDGTLLWALPTPQTIVAIGLHWGVSQIASTIFVLAKRAVESHEEPTKFVRWF